MRGGLAAAPGLADRSAFAAAARPAVRPDVLLLLIAAVIFTYVWRFQNVIPGAQLLRPTLLLGLAIVAAAVQVPPDLLARRLWSSVLGLLVLLLLIAAAGLPFALDPAVGTRYLLTWVMPGAVLATLIVIAVRGAEDVEWLLLATVTGAAVYLATVYARGGANAVTNPAATVFYDRNDLSLMLVALIPAALHLAWAGQPPMRRVLATTCFLVFVFTIVRGGSRGGLVGLVVVLGYMLLTFQLLPRRARVWTAIATLLLLAGGGSAYWGRVRTIFQPETDYNWSGRTCGRGEVWRRGLTYVRQRPVVGVGANGFPIAERELSRPARERLMVGRPFETLNAHNIFLQIAAELGLPGLIVFVALVVHMARTLSRVRRRHAADPRLSGVAHVLLAALLAYVVCGFFLSAAYFPFWYLLIGLVAATAAVARAQAVAAARTSRAGLAPSRGASSAQLPPYEVPAPARW
ncbi:MAG: O-antigen ligase family protein [Gemmatimonadaceae bacterium]